MKSRLNLRPGQKGIKRLVERFGSSLLYVRYRYDELRGVRWKTVELIVEEKQWRSSPRLQERELVPIAIEYSEKELREQVKAAKGRWDSKEKLWRAHGLRYALPVRLEPL